MALPVAAGFGVLNDADHILDYYLWYVKKKRKRVFVLFHGWEYTALGLAFVFAVQYHPLLLAAVLGHLGHMAGDQLANRPRSPLAYSMLYRIYRRFDHSTLFEEQPPSTLSETLHHYIPMWSRIEPLADRVASKFGVRLTEY